MSLELVVGLLGSQLVRAVASEVATNLASQVVQQAITSAVTVQRDEPTRPSVAAAGAPRLRALSTVDVISATPGRARLRPRGLRGDASRAEELAARLWALDGVTAAESNPLTGTLLVRFDAERVTLPEIMAALEPRRADAHPDSGAPARPLLRVVGR